MNSMEKHFETEAIRSQLNRTEFLEHSVPLYLTSSFVFEDAEDMRASFTEEKERNIYSRFTNPNTTEFVEKMCHIPLSDQKNKKQINLPSHYTPKDMALLYMHSLIQLKVTQ